jgi:hypothetical protein
MTDVSEVLTASIIRAMSKDAREKTGEGMEHVGQGRNLAGPREGGGNRRGQTE